MHRLRTSRHMLTHLPIRWRLALVSFSLLAVLLVALGIALLVIEEEALLASQYQVLNNQANQLFISALKEANVKSAGFKIAEADGQPLHTAPISQELSIYLSNLVQLFNKTNPEASIILADGKVISPTTSEQSGELRKPGEPPRAKIILEVNTIQQWLKGPTQYLLLTDNYKQREMVVLRPLINQDGVIALFQMHMSIKAIDQSITLMRLLLGFGIAGVLGIAALLTLPLISGALRPLVEMERVSRRIADGALSLRLQEPGTRDEVGRLARSFNSMVERLEAAFAQQKQFVADASHELRTPLTALGGSLEMLLLEADDGDMEATRRLMRGMYQEVERMQRLVADLLVLSRLDEGQMKLREDVVDMGMLAKGVCEQVEQLAQGREIQCIVDTPLPLLHGDTDQLRRVLLNIVGNALKFTPAHGRIVLHVYCKGERQDSIVLEVSDTGCGIPPEALPHVCERFYRVDAARTRTTRKDGSGLGLAIAQGLVQAHGGVLTISSMPGQGTGVTIQLPVQHS